MSCGGKDLMSSCDVQPSPFYVVREGCVVHLSPFVSVVDLEKGVDLVRLEWCPRCGLIRIPFDDRHET